MVQELLLSNQKVVEKEQNEQLHDARKHVGIGILGVCISVIYIVLSSIEIFFKGGFGLAVFGLLASSLYLFFSMRTLRLQKRIVAAKTEKDELAK